MNNGIKFIFGFVLGAAAGAAVTYTLVKEKYKQYADAEIEEIRELYSKKCDELKNSESDPMEYSEEDKEKDLDTTRTIIKENNYVNYSTNKKGGSESMSIKPEIISPDEYGQEYEYECESLVYYSGDGVLTDNFDNVIEDVNRMVGFGFENYFGEYEDDTVFVRNHEDKMDYEICRDERSFSEVVDSNLMENE